MENPQPWRGVFAIPCTPFTNDGELDRDGLASVIEFCVNAGAHGIVAPVLASEAWTLSTEERRIVIDALVAGIHGRRPAIIGISAETRAASLMLARQAEASGGDAVIAIPPPECGDNLETISAFFRELSTAITLPIFVQNVDPPYGV